MTTKAMQTIVYLINLHLLIQVNTNPIVNIEAPAISSNSQQSESALLTNFKIPNIKSVSQKNDEKSLESVELYSKKSLSNVLHLNNGFQQHLIRAFELSPVIETGQVNLQNNTSLPMLNIPRSIINTYEAFSNLLNWLIEKPKYAGRSISKAISQNLDNIGHKLMGL